MSDHKFLFLTAGIPGVFLFDRDKNSVSSAAFPRDARTILEKLEALENGEVIKEVEEVLSKVDTENIVTEFPLEIEGYHVEARDSISATEQLHKNIRNLSKESGFADRDADLNKVLRDIQVIRTRSKIKSSVEKDKFMAQAVSALQDLKEISNELSERLREWYGLYYPELKADENEKYAKLVSENGRREKFEDYKGSMGLDLDPKDVEMLQSFGKELKNLYELKDGLAKYLEEAMPEVAPNITEVIGSEMAAKLMSQAGSLENLAKMPSSKIQLLGAEKALFRHLKGGGKPPKYGVIYNHHYIQNTPEGKHGKVARAIASKIMMAARTDFYTDKFKGEEYKNELEKKIEDIRNS